MESNIECGSGNGHQSGNRSSNIQKTLDSVCDNTDSKEEGNEWGLQNEHLECSKLDDGSSLAGQVSAGNVGQKSDVLRSDEGSNAGQARSDSPLGSLENTGALETGIGMNHGIPSNEATKRNIVDEQVEKSSSLLEASNEPDSKKEPQPMLEADSEDSEAIEDEVKVCDTCGDAGIEELLAICSRCSDGAEHTYCMRILMHDLPEGDWLCEECKLKEEARDKEADKSVAKARVPEVNQHSEKFGTTFTPKTLPKLVTKQTDEEARETSKFKEESRDKEADKSETKTSAQEVNELSEKIGTTSNAKFCPKFVTKPTDEEAIETSKEQGSSQASDKRRDTDTEVTSVATKKASETSSGSSKEGDFSQVKPSKLVSSNSSIMPSGFQLSRGPLSKSSSFNNSNMKPKVKHLTGTVPPMPRPARYTSSNTKKEGLVKEMSRSISLKSVTAGYSNVESISKIQSKDVKLVKERNITEKKAFSTTDRPLVSPRPMDATGIPIPKSDTLASEKGSSGGRVLRCQRCNETGHSTQNCSIDKLRVTAVKPSVDRSLKDHLDKSKNWKDTVDAAISRTTIQKGHRLPDQIEKLIMPSPDMNSEVTLKNYHSISSRSVRNLPFLKGTIDGQESSRSSIADPNKTGSIINGKSQVIHRGGMPSDPRTEKLYSSPIISDELTLKAAVRLSPDQTSLPAHPSKASVIPELESIWQGGFEVLRTKRQPDLCEGIQAHLSSAASPKVLGVATKFPCRVQVVEVPRLSSWPSQFQGKGPNEDNIALFFFAKDTESYEKSYRHMVENMLLNDLVLKGEIDGFELLIFPSSTLPENAQRWNRLIFLWGLFRRRMPFLQDKLGGGSTSTVQPFPCSLISDVPTSPIKNSTENQDEELSTSDSLKVTGQLPSLSTTYLSSGMDSNVAFQKNSSSGSEGGKGAATHVPACTSHLKQGAYAEASRREKEHTLIEDGEVEDVIEIDYLSWELSLDRKRSQSASSSIPIDDEKESKKMKLDSGRHADDEGSLIGPNIPDLELALGGEKKLPKKDLLPLFSPSIIYKGSSQDKVPGPSKSDNRDDDSASLSLSLAFPASE